MRLYFDLCTSGAMKGTLIEVGVVLPLVVPEALDTGGLTETGEPKRERKSPSKLIVRLNMRKIAKIDLFNLWLLGMVDITMIAGVEGETPLIEETNTTAADTTEMTGTVTRAAY